MSNFDELHAEQLRALVRAAIRDVLSSGLPVTETVNLSTGEDLAAFVERLLDLDPDQREITEVLSAGAGLDHVTGREP